MEEVVTFIATGDSFITRPLPSQKNHQFKQVQEIITEADFSFTNFEVTIQDEQAFPSATSGGTWAVAPIQVTQSIVDYGFNCVAWANNHTLDYSYGGLKATMQSLNDHQLLHAGVGENLAEASSPKYLETTYHRIALIAATSTFDPTWSAGHQRKDCKGRPGVNPLRFKEIYGISEYQLNVLKEIEKESGYNAYQDLMIEEGFIERTKSSEVNMNNMLFSSALSPGKHEIINENDRDRNLAAIKDARLRADYVVMSIHSHEMKSRRKDESAEFIERFARECIDNGADAIICHGPHILRGIEIYKNRPIFYSLGNFIFQNDSVPVLPSDFYEKYNSSDSDLPGRVLAKRSKNNTIGLGVNPKVWESIIPKWKMKAGQLIELELIPIELGYELPHYRRGWPSVSDNIKILNDLKKLSSYYGTEIKIDVEKMRGYIDV